MIDDDASNAVDVRRDLPVGPVDIPEDLDCLLYQLVDAVVLGDIVLVSQRRVESIRHVDEENAARHGSGVVPVHDIREGVDIALAVATSLPVLSHDAFRVDCEPNGGEFFLSDWSILLAEFHLYVDVLGRRADYEIGIPPGLSFTNRVILLVDEFAVPGRLSERFALVEEVVEQEQTGGGTVGGRARMVAVLAKPFDDSLVAVGM
ncbi:hypothetical protein [Haloplanus ruber]|uniref:Uncharacterized protein n=1 Tax=Haloplanus ruber TaxID=869892 RepID=A0ABD6D0G7_9EURY|nr:hypothetical protein [Haloplanus ruber]